MVIIIATGNAHKADEIRRILGETNRYVTLKDLPGAIKTREDAETFEGNARKKAFGLAKWLQGAGAEVLKRVIGDGARDVFVLADDSGLEVDALHGAPGVHSARYASLEMGGEENSTDAANNRKLTRLLDGVPLEQRTARFRCVIAWVKLHGGELTAATFDGVCEGRVDARPSGAGGFGYDPLFVPQGRRKSFAELSEEEKNEISHRGRALEKLKGKIESDLA